jgi:hypothetical protein
MQDIDHGQLGNNAAWPAPRGKRWSLRNSGSPTSSSSLTYRRFVAPSRIIVGARPPSSHCSTLSRFTPMRAAAVATSRPAVSRANRRTDGSTETHYSHGQPPSCFDLMVSTLRVTISLSPRDTPPWSAEQRQPRSLYLAPALLNPVRDQALVRAGRVDVSPALDLPSLAPIRTPAVSASRSGRSPTTLRTSATAASVSS